MRLGRWAAFELGVAAGIVSLSLVLWATGRLNPPLRVKAGGVAKDEISEAGRAAPEPGTKPRLEMPIAGVDPAKLTSNFAEAHNGQQHEALDIMAPRGTPVLAVDNGDLVKLFTSRFGGLTVYQFNLAQDLCYYYAHLDHYAEGIKEGMRLRRGQVLGYVGSTGNASPDAPHLHFGISILGPERQWWKSTAIDPLPLLQGRQP